MLIYKTNYEGQHLLEDKRKFKFKLNVVEIDMWNIFLNHDVY